ncbi:MAG TPA: hypothetical protein VFR02_05975, partial [bacterium]|nr:hypothetical protein [bacterium]
YFRIFDLEMVAKPRLYRYSPAAGDRPRPRPCVPKLGTGASVDKKKEPDKRRSLRWIFQGKNEK